MRESITIMKMFKLPANVIILLFKLYQIGFNETLKQSKINQKAVKHNLMFH